MTPKPPNTISLTWKQGLEFEARTDRSTFVLDSAGVAGPSPVDALLGALAGCMAMDLAHILTRGRHPFTSLRAALTGDRAPDHPHRLLRAQLHFVVGGAVPPGAVERAIALSRDTYCSVWQSLRQDIAFEVTFEIL